MSHGKTSALITPWLNPNCKRSFRQLSLLGCLRKKKLLKDFLIRRETTLKDRINYRSGAGIPAKHVRMKRSQVGVLAYRSTQSQVFFETSLLLRFTKNRAGIVVIAACTVRQLHFLPGHIQPALFCCTYCVSLVKWTHYLLLFSPLTVAKRFLGKAIPDRTLVFVVG